MGVSFRRIAGSALIGAALVISSASSSSVATTPNYPTRDIRIIVGFSAGGGTDIVARLVAAELSERLKRSVVVENLVGATGALAAREVAKAEPDGHTVLWAPTAYAFTAAAGEESGYNIIDDFEPVSLLVASPALLVAHPSLPASTPQELIALAKEKPGEISFASGGAGSSSHVSAELFALRAGIELLHIPYQGGARLTAVLQGEADQAFVDVQAAVPLVEAGELKAIGISIKDRSKLLPNIPALAEAGIDYDYSIWYGALLPKGTPADVVTALRNAIAEAVHSPKLSEQFDSTGSRVMGSTPEEFRTFLASEIGTWKEVFAAAGLAEQSSN